MTPDRREGLSQTRTLRKTIPGSGNRKMLRVGDEFDLLEGSRRSHLSWSLVCESVVSNGVGSELVGFVGNSESRLEHSITGKLAVSRECLFDWSVPCVR